MTDQARKQKLPSTNGASRTAQVLPFAVTLLAVAATIALFFPGSMSNDSITQYQHVGGGYWHNVKPPIMRHLWWLTDHVICGPGGIFLVHVVAYWCGVDLIVFHVARIAGILLLGFFPPPFGLLATIWTDVGMMASWMLAAGLLLRLGRPASGSWLVFLTGLALFCGAPLPLIAPSAEFRYILWLISATLVAMLLLVASHKRSSRALSMICNAESSGSEAEPLVGYMAPQ